MTSTEIKARKMDIMEALMSLDEEKLSKVEKYIRKLMGEQRTYEMPSDLLDALLTKANEDLKNGKYIEEQEMELFINSLQ